jgi:hypothetical protein
VISGFRRRFWRGFRVSSLGADEKVEGKEKVGRERQRQRQPGATQRESTTVVSLGARAEDGFGGSVVVADHLHATGFRERIRFGSVAAEACNL